MPFIGQQPLTGAYHKLDSITTSETATYNLQLNGGDYSPASANHLLVSLNGVIQAPQDSFTVSGTQIIFAESLSSSDVIDFIMAFGDVLGVGVPTDGSVNTNQIANGAVTSAKINDGAVTLAKLASDASSGLVTEIDQWRISSSYSSSNNQVISSNWERADTGGFGQKGTGLTESSGYFSFPETGYYKIDAQSLVLSSTSASPELQIHVTTDNSSYSVQSRAYTNVDGRNSSIFVSYIFKVTNITNCKFVFVFYTNSGTSMVVMGDSTIQTTGFNCTRLGGL